MTFCLLPSISILFKFWIAIIIFLATLMLFYLMLFYLILIDKRYFERTIFFGLPIFFFSNCLVTFLVFSCEQFTHGGFEPTSQCIQFSKLLMPFQLFWKYFLILFYHRIDLNVGFINYIPNHFYLVEFSHRVFDIAKTHFIQMVVSSCYVTDDLHFLVMFRKCLFEFKCFVLEQWWVPDELIPHSNPYKIVNFHLKNTLYFVQLCCLITSRDFLFWWQIHSTSSIIHHLHAWGLVKNIAFKYLCLYYKDEGFRGILMIH